MISMNINEPKNKKTTELVKAKVSTLKRLAKLTNL